MANCNMQNNWRIGLALSVLIGVTLACGGVEPSDERLQPVLMTKIIALNDFIGDLVGVSAREVTKPLITYPQNSILNADSEIEIAGWSELVKGCKVSIYEVTPNSSLAQVLDYQGPLLSVPVDPETNAWTAVVNLTENTQYLAARLELANGRTSPFSNIIFVHQGELEDLVMLSPPDDSEFEGPIKITGTGEPGFGLQLFINGETTSFSTHITENGDWEFEDVTLVRPGFDILIHYGWQDYRLEVLAPASNQRTEINLRRWFPDPNPLITDQQVAKWLEQYNVDYGGYYGSLHNHECAKLTEPIVNQRPLYGWDNTCAAYVKKEGLDALDRNEIQKLNRCDVLCVFDIHTVIVLNVRSDEIDILEQNWGFPDPTGPVQKRPIDISSIENDSYLLSSSGCK